MSSEMFIEHGKVKHPGLSVVDSLREMVFGSLWGDSVGEMLAPQLSW
ncbi:MAG TPA: hypothetical protein VGK64_14050 [Bryobacteraceae bacterium]